MSQSNTPMLSPLRKRLFYKGQIYFQILAAFALIIGTVALRWIFTTFQLPEYIFKVVFLIGFSLTLMVIAFQAYLHHNIVHKGLSPVSWLSQEVKSSLQKFNRYTSEASPNIVTFEKEMEEILSALENYKDQYKEVQDLTETLRHFLAMLKNYWKAATRNEVLSAIGRISAEMAHDLKSPLSSFQTALNFLQRHQNHDPEFQKCLNLMELSHQRLTGIVDNLLLKYRGKEEEKSLFSIHQVLDEIIGEYHLQGRNHGVKFIKQYHSQDLCVCGNVIGIQRVFQNLIKNAAESMQWTGKLTLKTGLEKNHVIIEVADTGCGIPKNKIDKIFGDYSEGKKTGHGIGLQYVKKTVETHGGQIAVESVFGEGSQFLVKLPLAASPSLTIPSFAIVCRSTDPIFVIDDDPSLLEQWRLVLGEKGISVKTYLSYEAFEQDQENEKVSLRTAIIDYHFENSEWDGLKIIEKLKEMGLRNLYLCTVEYWKPSLKREAQVLGVPIIPKPLPEIVIVNPAKEEGYQVLVIDDEDSIRLAWEVIQDKLHIEKLYSFPNLETLQSQAIDFQTIDIAFVDKNIQNSQFSGAEAAAYLKSKGVAKVVLASGENEAALRRDPAFAEVDFISTDKIPSTFKAFFS